MVSDTCQINDLDHSSSGQRWTVSVSDTCQINDLDHRLRLPPRQPAVSDTCQINDLDHEDGVELSAEDGFRYLSDQ